MSNQRNNDMIFDNAGKPSMMVRIPKFNLSDVIEGAPDTPHPAFVVGGKEVPEIWVSKYQNVIVGGKAYSLPFQQPAVGVNYDQAREACESKGPGWHLISNAEWAAIALWAKKNGTLPRGNNNWGNDHAHEDERGETFDQRKVLTGSGPASWSHDGTPEGVYDLNGNVWEWVSGLRLADGEIQVIPGNDVALKPDQSPTSEEWTAIASDGYSLKYAELDDDIQLTIGTAGGYGGCSFSELKADAEVPFLVQALGLFPVDDEPLTDWFWMDAEESERLPLRGGGWYNGANAGVIALNLSNPRSYSNSSIGFRSAFVPGI